MPRRMFSLEVVGTDCFLEMAPKTQCVYYQLCLRADDEGIIGSPKQILRALKANESCLKELSENGYIIRFDSGVIVIRHWHVHNKIPKDRHKPTIYTVEWDAVIRNSSDIYELRPTVNNTENPLNVGSTTTSSIQNDIKPYTEDRVGKIDQDQESFREPKDSFSIVKESGGQVEDLSKRTALESKNQNLSFSDEELEAAWNSKDSVDWF